MKAFSLGFFLSCYCMTSMAMQSSQYSINSLSENQGGGFRGSTNYQITQDIISKQPKGDLSSSQYQIQAGDFTAVNTTRPSCGIFIENDSLITSSTTINLDLICGSSLSCTQMSFSNNGVSWSTPEAFQRTKQWELFANDGARKVYAKFKNSLDEWSAVCHDSIALDTSAPVTSISPVGGTYMGSQQITISSNEPATIYYTTDGIAPSNNSTIYSQAVTLTQDTTLKAFSIDATGKEGSIVSEDYTICNGSNLSISGMVTDAHTDETMPLVSITLDNGQTTTTDIDGNYSFSGLSRGYYNINSVTAPSPGYVTYQKPLTLCKHNISHNILLSNNSALLGNDTSSGYSVDSVNTSTGNYSHSITDIQIPGKGIPFEFTRGYNTQDTNNGPLGYGWTHNFNIQLTEDNSIVRIRWGDGKVETWIPDGNDGYTAMDGVFSTLEKQNDNSFILRLKNMTEYHFDTSNQLLNIIDDNSNTLSFSYTGSNLTSVTDTSGRQVSFAYDVNNRITRILDPIGRSILFTYDEWGDLVSSTDLDDQVTTYTYNENHQLLSLTDPLGNLVMRLAYDQQRRVVQSQKDALGGEVIYSYDTASKVTQILDPMGNASYHYYDDNLRLIKEVDPLGNFTTYVYNNRGNVETFTDKNGNITSYIYDAKGNVLTKTNALNQSISATYDSDNNPLTKTDAKGNVTTFTYDASGNLRTQTDTLGNIITYTYNSFGAISTVTDALDNVTSYEYDVYGNQVAVVDALGNRTTYSYDSIGRKLSENFPLGHSTAYEYDDMDRLIRVTDALGGVTVFEYDVNGNKTAHLDAKGNRTTFSYDAKDRLIAKTNALTNTESYGYDALDRRTRITDYNGNLSQVVYDALGQVIQEIDAQGSRVQYEYDANGNKTKQTDAKGNISTYTYDVLDRLVSATDPLGNTTSYSYDANGNQTTVSNSFGQTTTTTYDELDRVTGVSDPLGNQINTSYDGLSRITQVSDARGQATTFEYDDLGRLIKVTDASGGIVTATYDALGNRLSMTDSLNHTTTYSYDLLNRLTQETDPLGNSEIMSYDELGNLLSHSNSDGSSRYQYNAINQLTSILYPDSTGVAYTYDANGNRLTVTDNSGTTTYTYDSRNLIHSVTDPFGMTVGYSYDPNANRSAIKYPGYRHVSYFYDELDRLAAIQDWTGTSTSFSYDKESRLTEKVMGNGVVVGYEYDNSGRLTRKSDKKTNNEIIVDYQLSLDANGNRTSITMEQPLLPDIPSRGNTYTHNAANQVLTNNTKNYSYDGKGNRITKTDGGTTTLYQYNFHDRLTQISDGINTYAYTYSSDGHRLSTTANGTETRYLQDINADLEQVLAEMDSFNQIQTYYIYGDGLLYSIDGATGSKSYYHYDTIGSTLAMTDSNQVITNKYAYLPYGEVSNSETPQNNNFTYVGKFGVMQDRDDLYFMRARFYDPDSRVFLGRDIVKGDINRSNSINRYMYSLSNPILMVDPDGELVFTTAAAIGFVALKIWATYELTIVTADLASEAVHGHGITEKQKKTADEGFWTGMSLWLSAKSAIFGGVNEAKELYENADDIRRGRRRTPMEVKEQYISADFKTYSTRKRNVLEPTQTKIATDYSSTSNSVLGSTSNTKKIIKVTKKPKQYHNVGKYARRAFSKNFSKLTSKSFINSQTRSYIELRIEQEIYSLQKHRKYGYRDKKRKRKEKKRMERDINSSVSRLYAQLTSALSKYAVLVNDLGRIPNAGQSSGGIYAR